VWERLSHWLFSVPIAKITGRGQRVALALLGGVDCAMYRFVGHIGLYFHANKKLVTRLPTANPKLWKKKNSKISDIRNIVSHIKGGGSLPFFAYCFIRLFFLF